MLVEHNASLPTITAGAVHGILAGHVRSGSGSLQFCGTLLPYVTSKSVLPFP